MCVGVGGGAATGVLRQASEWAILAGLTAVVRSERAVQSLCDHNRTLLYDL